jgi:hypothetical protein
VSEVTDPVCAGLPLVEHVPVEVMLVWMDTTPVKLPLHTPAVVFSVWPPLAQFEFAALNHCAPVSVQVVPVGAWHPQLPTPQERPSTALV